MPTQLLRTQVTHTPAVTHALETARQTWPDESDSRLLLHLIEAGEHAVRSEMEERKTDRVAMIDRISARYADLPSVSLESIRKGWPE